MVTFLTILCEKFSHFPRIFFIVLFADVDAEKESSWYIENAWHSTTREKQKCKFFSIHTTVGIGKSKVEYTAVRCIRIFHHDGTSNRGYKA